LNASKPDRSVEYRPGPENGRPGPRLSRYSRPGPSLSGPVWGSNCSEEKKILCVFFAFQAILNTFYFCVKNFEKKYSKSQEDTPPPHNWKNILYLYFMFHAILSTFKFFWKNKYLIGTDGPVKFLPARSDFVVFKCCNSVGMGYNWIQQNRTGRVETWQGRRYQLNIYFFRKI